MSEPTATAIPAPKRATTLKRPNRSVGGRAYTKAIMIRILPEQNDYLHEQAAAAGMTVSTWIRVKLKLEKPQRDWKKPL